MGKAVPGKLSCTKTGCVILTFCFFGQFNAGKTWCFRGAIVIEVLINNEFLEINAPRYIQGLMCFLVF